MNGKHHLISGAATIVSMGAVAALLYRASGNVIAEALSMSAQFVVSEMMGGHIAFSIGLAVGIALYFVGCLLPDIDSDDSMISRFGSIPVKHRTWTHSIWLVVFIGLVGVFFWPFKWLALGCFVHIFWDSASRMGVCWFYPYPGYIEYESGARVKRNHWLWLYRSNSLAESVVCAVSVLVACALVAIVLLLGTR